VKSNVHYWGPKVATNRARDERHREALQAAGWTVLTIWECQSRDLAALDDLIANVRAAVPRRR
jgi:DNA mismatch endonuclease, patch repair protein